MSDHREIAGKPWYVDLSIIRWIFAIFGILIMLFTGGCSLLVISDTGVAGVVALFGGVPFSIGLLIWWLAAKVGRTQSNQ